MRRVTRPVRIHPAPYRLGRTPGPSTMFSPKRNPAAHLLMDAVMPFGDHLEELRKRMIYSLLGIVPLFLVAVSFSQPMLDFLTQPVRQALNDADLSAQLIQTGPTEAFMTALKLATVLTILAGSPWILFQAWLFVAPGLYNNERRFVYILLPLSAALTATAIVFLYAVLLPIILAFFIAFGTGVSKAEVKTAPPPEGLVFPTIPVLGADPDAPAPGAIWYNQATKELRIALPSGQAGAQDGEKAAGVDILGTPMTRSSGILQQYRITEYTKLVLSLAMAFSLGFQTPVVVLLLGWVGIIEPTNLLKYRRHVVMVCLVLGAVLTPADPLSMLLLAVPLYVLFEFGVVLHRVLPAERVSGGFSRKNREGPDAGDE